MSKSTGEISVGAQLEVEVLRAAYGGDVIAQSPDGRVVFLRGAAPGDRVRIRITQVKRRFLRAVIESVRPSPDRSQPFCELFDTCGGCPWQAIPQRKQRAVFENELRRLMTQLNADKLDVEPIWSDDGRAWRATARLHLVEGRLGFYRRGSHDVVDIAECPILAPPLDAMLHSLRAWLPRTVERAEIRLSARPGSRSGTAALSKLRPQERRRLLSDAGRLTTGPFQGALLEDEAGETSVIGDIINRLGPYNVHHSAESFMQAHQAGSEAILADVMAQLADVDSLLELYSGSGNFTFALAERGVRVKAVEYEKTAAEKLRAAAEMRGLDSVIQVVSGRAEDNASGGFNAALLDPPRAGARDAIAAIHRGTIRRIVYVSCDLPTLARDARWLCERGWRVRWVRLYDVFPNSGRVESVMSFIR